MSNIRVTYSGLLTFSAGIASVFTGLIFTLMITRSLSPVEFGTWGLITSIIGYLLISESLIGYWNVRQIARGDPVGRTSLYSVPFLLIVVIPIYLGYSYYLSDTSDVIFNSFLLGVILVPVFFVSRTVENINYGFKPQVTSYTFLVFEIAKIPAGLALVVFLDLGIDGAIFALLIAYLSRLIIQFYFARQKLRENFDFQIFRRWMRMSIVPIYNSLPGYLSMLDIIIFPIIVGSVLGLAYFYASFIIANLVIHSVLISKAIYPKLLADGGYKQLSETFSLFLYFAIPLLAISIIFSRSGLFALNPEYEIAVVVVIILSFRQFFFAIQKFLQPILLGIEKVDVENKVKFSNLIKSKLFLVPTINIIHYGLYIIVLILVLYYLTSNNFSDLELVKFWAIIGLVLEIPFTIYMWILVQKYVKFSISINSIIKYVVATLAFAFVFMITSEYIIEYKTSIFDFLPLIIIQLAICVGVYFSITYLIDSRTREICKAILKELSTRN